jgi:hypothetical protein
VWSKFTCIIRTSHSKFFIYCHTSVSFDLVTTSLLSSASPSISIFFIYFIAWRKWGMRKRDIGTVEKSSKTCVSFLFWVQNLSLVSVHSVTKWASEWVRQKYLQRSTEKEEQVVM